MTEVLLIQAKHGSIYGPKVAGSKIETDPKSRQVGTYKLGKSLWVCFSIYKFDTLEVSKDHQNAKYELECEIQDVVQNNFKECSSAKIRLILAAHFPFANQLKQIILTEQPTFFTDTDMPAFCYIVTSFVRFRIKFKFESIFFCWMPNKMKDAIQSCIKDLTGHFSG